MVDRGDGETAADRIREGDLPGDGPGRRAAADRPRRGPPAAVGGPAAGGGAGRLGGARLQLPAQLSPPAGADPVGQPGAGDAAVPLVVRPLAPPAAPRWAPVPWAVPGRAGRG